MGGHYSIYDERFVMSMAELRDLIYPPVQCAAAIGVHVNCEHASTKIDRIRRNEMENHRWFTPGA